MIIKLESLGDKYSRQDHALFVMQSSVGSKGVFYEAIEEERQVERDVMRNKRK